MFYSNLERAYTKFSKVLLPFLLSLALILVCYVNATNSAENTTVNKLIILELVTKLTPFVETDS
jgi:hypothetical protein